MAMAPDTNDQRLELLQGTLDMLILRTFQWGPQHGHGIGQGIRAQSDDLLKVETKGTKGILRWSYRNLKHGGTLTIPLLALFACILSIPLAGQWLNQPTAGIPRKADGKPNLTAPAPRAADGHPDLSGFWRSNWKGIFDVTSD